MHRIIVNIYMKCNNYTKLKYEILKIVFFFRCILKFPENKIHPFGVLMQTKTQIEKKINKFSKRK